MTGTDPAPRYEFRVFGGDLRPALDMIEKTAPFGPEEAREDLYLVVHNRPDCGLKLRGPGSRLELKRLIHTERGCELWEPTASEDLPLSGSEITDRFLSPVGLPSLPRDKILDRSALLNAVDPFDGVRRMTVKKRRRQCTIGSVICEHGRFAFSGGNMEGGLAFESTELEQLCDLICRLDMDARENVSLPRHLLRLSLERT